MMDNLHGKTAAAVLLAILVMASVFFESIPGIDSSGKPAWLLGLLFGFALQRSRFCFYCNLKDLFNRRDSLPVIGILIALITGTLGYLVLFESWVPDPGLGWLPPGAHIGPAGWHLLVTGLLFGWGMALSGSCISAHLYRLGEGSLIAPFALAGVLAGFTAGYMSWNTIYLTIIADAPVIWGPEKLGYTGSAILSVGILTLLALWLRIKYNSLSDSANHPMPVAEPGSLRSMYRSAFIDRWPSWIGGVWVGILAVVYYFRVEPLGVTAEAARLSRAGAGSAGIIPDRLAGLDTLSGCIPDAGEAIISTNGIFIIGLVLGALFGGLLAGQFRPRIPAIGKAGKAVAGGFLLGFSAMISLGCTIGVTLSGIMAFALSGWLFTTGMVAGVWSGIKWLKDEN
jgi:uncharacterized protein